MLRVAHCNPLFSWNHSSRFTRSLIAFISLAWIENSQVKKQEWFISVFCMGFHTVDGGNQNSGMDEQRLVAKGSCSPLWPCWRALVQSQVNPRISDFHADAFHRAVQEMGPRLATLKGPTRNEQWRVGAPGDLLYIGDGKTTQLHRDFHTPIWGYL